MYDNVKKVSFSVISTVLSYPDEIKWGLSTATDWPSGSSCWSIYSISASRPNGCIHGASSELGNISDCVIEMYSDPWYWYISQIGSLGKSSGFWYLLCASHEPFSRSKASSKPSPSLSVPDITVSTLPSLS